MQQRWLDSVQRRAILAAYSDPEKFSMRRMLGISLVVLAACSTNTNTTDGSTTAGTTDGGTSTGSGSSSTGSSSSTTGRGSTAGTSSGSTTGTSSTSGVTTTGGTGHAWLSPRWVDDANNIYISDSDNSVVPFVAGETGTYYGVAVGGGNIATIAGHYNRSIPMRVFK